MKTQRHPWTVDYLSSLPDTELDEIAKRAAASLALAKLRAGRVILAMQKTGLPKRLGYKNALHYFKLAGARYTEARECQRVARRCEELPLLKDAAETGRIGWTHLREVVRVATPETEADWMESCRRHGTKAVQQMVKHARVCKKPPAASSGPSAAASPVPSATPSPEPGSVELRLKLPADINALLAEVTRQLSEQAGRALSLPQVMKCLLARYLTGHAFPGPRRWNQLLGHDTPEPDKNSQGFPPAPWGAVAATDEPCPGEPTLQIVRPAPAHWESTETRRREAFPCACPDCPGQLWLEVHEVVYYCEGWVTVPYNLLTLCSSCESRMKTGALRVERLTGGELRWSDQHGRELNNLVPKHWSDDEGEAKVWAAHLEQCDDPEFDDADFEDVPIVEGDTNQAGEVEHDAEHHAELNDAGLNDAELNDAELDDAELAEAELEDDEAFWPRDEWEYDPDIEDDGADMSAWSGPRSMPSLARHPAKNSRESVGSTR